jgi:hypothetical protein
VPSNSPVTFSSNSLLYWDVSVLFASSCPIRILSFRFARKESVWILTYNVSCFWTPISTNFGTFYFLDSQYTLSYRVWSFIPLSIKLYWWVYDRRLYTFGEADWASFLFEVILSITTSFCPSVRLDAMKLLFYFASS